MEKFKFTKTAIKDLMPEEKEVRYADAEQNCLILRVMPSGHKSFNFQRKVKGKTTRISLGAFPDVTIEQARLKVRELMNTVISGGDVNNRDSKMTFDDLVSEYFRNFEIRVSAGERRQISFVSAQRIYNNHVRTMLGPVRLFEFDQKFTSKIILQLKDKSPALFNRCLVLIKAVFNYAIDNDINKDNPFNKYQKMHIKPRERFLQPQELEPFFTALLEEKQIYRDLVMITLFTGQRKSCILSMEWSEIDFQNKIWVIPTSKMKAKRPHAVPIISAVESILERRLQEREVGEKFVFPSKNSDSGHISEKSGERSFWRRIITRAGLFNQEKSLTLCIHDLRRTMGSWQAMNNESLLVISKVLGHTDVSITASVYAHLQVDKARAGMETAVSAMLDAANVTTGDARLVNFVNGLSANEKVRLLEILQSSMES